MFPHLKNFNLKQWVDENRGNWGQRRTIWADSDFIAFVTRGPNSRTDFHIDPGDEIFYQLEGELNLHFMTPEQKHKIAVIKEGELFLLPANVPHSPRRGEGSWTFVIERKRRPDEQDRFVWYCEGCGTKLYETTVHFDDPTDAVKRANDSMKTNKEMRTCPRCGEA